MLYHSTHVEILQFAFDDPFTSVSYIEHEMDKSEFDIIISRLTRSVTYQAQ